MVNASRTPDTQQPTGWFPSLRALGAITWRLSILLTFFVGVCFSVHFDHWWAALGFIIGFVVAAFLIRRVSTVEQETSSPDTITFL